MEKPIKWIKTFTAKKYSRSSHKLYDEFLHMRSFYFNDICSNILYTYSIDFENLDNLLNRKI